MVSLIRDSRYAIRTISKKPLFATSIVMWLALGIGATTAVFGFVRAVLLLPLPYHEPEKVVVLWGSRSQEVKPGISAPNLNDIRTQTSAFEELSFFLGDSGGRVSLGPDAKDLVNLFRVGPHFFSVLGVQPYRGRLFSPDEESSATARTVLISFSFWRSHFGHDESVVGKEIVLGGEKYSIVGIMPPGFFFLDQRIQIWTPLNGPADSQRGTSTYYGLARLRPGVALAAAQSEVDVVVRRLVTQYADSNRTLVVGLFSASDILLGDYRKALWSLLLGVSLLLLIACGNVAHLFLVGAVRRRSEIAVRVAFGATRQAIVRQLFIESLLLGAGGGTAGVLLAIGVVRVLLSLKLTNIPRFDQAKVDPTTLFFALVITLMSTVVFGVFPASYASSPNLSECLKRGTAGSTGSAPKRWRELLVISEVALGFVLMVGAGLLINSFVRLSRVQWGFRPENILIVDTRTPPRSNYDIPTEVVFAQEVEAKLKNMPRIEAVGVARGSPIDFVLGGANALSIHDGREVHPRLDVVGPGYFETLRIPILHGRAIAPRDGALAERVAIVDKALAAELWPGQDPIGKRVWIIGIKGKVWQEFVSLRTAGENAKAAALLQDIQSREETEYTVVGEVPSVLMYGPSPVNHSAVYIDYRQRPPYIPLFGLSFFALCSSQPLALGETVRKAIGVVNDPWEIIQIDSLEDRVVAAIGGRGSDRLLLLVSSVASALGLAFAALGIHSCLSYTTSLRISEIGVRMALGAQRRQIFIMIIGRGLLTTFAGLLIGGVVSYFVMTSLEKSLFGIRSGDPVTFAAAGVLFLAVASVACYFPARFATQVQPIAALRYE